MFDENVYCNKIYIVGWFHLCSYILKYVTIQYNTNGTLNVKGVELKEYSVYSYACFSDASHNTSQGVGATCGQEMMATLHIEMYSDIYLRMCIYLRAL